MAVFPISVISHLFLGRSLNLYFKTQMKRAKAMMKIRGRNLDCFNSKILHAPVPSTLIPAHIVQLKELITAKITKRPTLHNRKGKREVRDINKPKRDAELSY